MSFKSKLNDIAHHKKTKELAVAPLRYFFLIAIGYIVLFQLFYMVSYAFRPSSEMADSSVVWIPRHPTFDRFIEAFDSMKYFETLWNTLSVQIVSALIEVITCAIVAYGFARFKFPFKGVLFAFVLVTIMVPPIMVSIPLFLNYAYFDIFGILGLISEAVGTELRPNLIDTGWVFWLPSLFASGLRSGLFIFIYRQFFKGLPYELEEAASIDGAGPVKTFMHIIIPSSGVAILTVAIFSVVWHWNEYDLSMLYFNNSYPLSVRLSQITTQMASGAVNDRGFTMAAALLFVLPVLIMYIILQRKFIQSIDRVGIVGQFMIKEDIRFKVLSSLDKCFIDEKLDDKKALTDVSILKNEKLSFQIGYQNMGYDFAFMSVRVEGALADYITFQRVVNVPVTYPGNDSSREGGVLRSTPGLYPDLLLPMTFNNRVKLPYNHNLHTLWAELSIPEDAVPAGVYNTHFSFICGEEVVAEADLSIEVIDAILPEIDFIHTEWFYCDCLAEYYKVPVFSDRHFEIIEEFIKTAVENNINAILMPLFTPPLDTYVGGERLTCQLVDIFVNNGEYSFDFSKCDRWIEICQKYGVKYYEIPHLFTQWGAKKAPKFMAWVDGEYKRIFGWEDDALGEAYKSFLSTFLPAFVNYIKEKGIDKQCFFHISDEPSSEHLEQYKADKEMVLTYLKDFDIMDALSSLSFYKDGVVSRPVVCCDHAADFINEGVENLWVYYCGGVTNVANRWLSMSGARTRILGTQLYKYNIKGFLHWGYNFYNNQFSYDAINPYTEVAGDYFAPAGDMFLVYPGPDGKPYPTIRLHYMRDVVQDYKALKLCEELYGFDFVNSIIQESIDYTLTFVDFPLESDYIHNLRNKVNEAIKNKM